MCPSSQLDVVLHITSIGLSSILTCILPNDGHQSMLRRALIREAEQKYSDLQYIRALVINTDTSLTRLRLKINPNTLQWQQRGAARARIGR